MSSSGHVVELSQLEEILQHLQIVIKKENPNDKFIDRISRNELITNF